MLFCRLVFPQSVVRSKGPQTFGEESILEAASGQVSSQEGRRLKRLPLHSYLQFACLMEMACGAMTSYSASC